MTSIQIKRHKTIHLKQVCPSMGQDNLVEGAIFKSYKIKMSFKFNFKVRMRRHCLVVSSLLLGLACFDLSCVNLWREKYKESNKEKPLFCKFWNSKFRKGTASNRIYKDLRNKRILRPFYLDEKSILGLFQDALRVRFWDKSTERWKIIESSWSVWDKNFIYNSLF